jgi:uncharacterized membrane protein (Fun14 family)
MSRAPTHGVAAANRLASSRALAAPLARLIAPRRAAPPRARRGVSAAASGAAAAAPAAAAAGAPDNTRSAAAAPSPFAFLRAARATPAAPAPPPRRATLVAAAVADTKEAHSWLEGAFWSTLVAAMALHLCAPVVTALSMNAILAPVGSAAAASSALCLAALAAIYVVEPLVGASVIGMWSLATHGVIRRLRARTTGALLRGYNTRSGAASPKEMADKHVETLEVRERAARKRTERRMGCLLARRAAVPVRLPPSCSSCTHAHPAPAPPRSRPPARADAPRPHHMSTRARAQHRRAAKTTSTRLTRASAPSSSSSARARCSLPRHRGWRPASSPSSWPPSPPS